MLSALIKMFTVKTENIENQPPMDTHHKVKADNFLAIFIRLK